MQKLVIIRARVPDGVDDENFDSDFENLCRSISHPFDVLPYRPVYAEWDGGGAAGPPDATVIAAIVGAIPVALGVIDGAIAIFLKKNENREITLEREGKRITIKGHSLAEEREMLKELFPEALNTGILRPGTE